MLGHAAYAEATAYFVDFVTKAYKALTDEAARANLEKYGNVDGPQGMAVGIALPKFMLDAQGGSGGVLLACLVGGGILAPLLAAVVYLSRAGQYNSNAVRTATLAYYYQLIKPSLASSKVLEVAVHAQELVEMPVRRSDDEALARVFTLVRSELGLDPKNPKQEQAKFWKKQHPALIKVRARRAHLPAAHHKLDRPLRLAVPRESHDGMHRKVDVGACICMPS